MACKGQPVQRRLEGFKSLPLDNARTAAVRGARDRGNVKLVADVEGGPEPRGSGGGDAQAHSDVNVLIGSSQAIEGARQAVKRSARPGRSS